MNYAYKKGKNIRTDFLTLRFVPSRGNDYRLAVVVSRKVSKSAVVRNRIRRRIYEIVRLSRAEASNPWQYDMIMTVFDERLATMPADSLREAVLRLLQKAGINGSDSGTR